MDTYRYSKEPRGRKYFFAMTDQKNQPQLSQVEQLTEKAMYGIGSITSLVIHTALFIGIFSLKMFGFNIEEILLILTTAVSLEAIYLSIFIQMSVNRNTESLEVVEENIDEIQEDVEDIQEDVEDLEEDIDKIQQEDNEEEDLDKKNLQILTSMEQQLRVMMKEIETLKNNRPQ